MPHLTAENATLRLAAADVVHPQRALDEARAACDATCGTCACAADAPAAHVVDAAVRALLVHPPDAARARSRSHASRRVQR